MVTHQDRECGLRFNTEKQKSPEAEPWHNWHKSEKASGTEAAVAAQ